MKRTSAAILTVLLAWALPPTAHPSEVAPVRIELLGEATVESTVIRLEQIAEVSGGSISVRKRIAGVDVADLRVLSESTTVTADQVKFRLLVAGVEPHQFQITGARETTVREADRPVTLRKVIASAEAALRQKHPAPTAAASVTPSRSLSLPALDLRPGERVRLEGSVETFSAQAGKAKVNVTLLVNGVPQEVVAVDLDITPMELPARPGEFRQTLRPVGNFEPSPKAEVVIKTRDAVKLVVRIGGARIEARGEAMEDGRIGGTIRVRNIESNRVVLGRVEASGRVLVEY